LPQNADDYSPPDLELFLNGREGSKGLRLNAIMA